MKATREGKRFILATFLIAVAAVNTGNNLIYLILSLLLSLILLSVILLKINLTGLSLEVSANGPIFAGEKTSLDLFISSRKRLIPTYSIHIIASGAETPLYLPIIPPGKTVNKEMKIIFKKRGLYSYGTFLVRSGFPFILMNSQRPLEVSGEALVYPALTDLENLLPEVSGYENGQSVRKIGAGEDIYSIREFRYGDDWRKIHWKASAKTSSLLVREYADYDVGKTTIIIDNLSKRAGEAAVTGSSEGEGIIFEKMVSLTASLARYFLDEGHLVRLLSCRTVIPFGSGNEHFIKILDILAVIQQESSWDTSVPFDKDGSLVTVKRSADSQVSNYAGESDMVIYADTI